VQAVILVGGFGTRLRPLTRDVPKQMLPVVDRPMIEHVVAHLATHGVTRVVLSLGFRPEAFSDAYPDGTCAGLPLHYAVEPEPLDTAGAVRFAALEAGIRPGKWSGIGSGRGTGTETGIGSGGGSGDRTGSDRGGSDTFLVLNGDVLTDLDITAMVASHRAAGAEATLALTEVDDPSRYGVVPTDAEGRVLGFVEKPDAASAPSRWINAGTYVLEPSILDRIPAGRRVSIEREVFPAMAAEGCLHAMQSDAYWIGARDDGCLHFVRRCANTAYAPYKLHLSFDAPTLAVLQTTYVRFATHYPEFLRRFEAASSTTASHRPDYSIGAFKLTGAMLFTRNMPRGRAPTPLVRLRRFLRSYYAWNRRIPNIVLYPSNGACRCSFESFMARQHDSLRWLLAKMGVRAAAFEPDTFLPFNLPILPETRVWQYTTAIRSRRLGHSRLLEDGSAKLGEIRAATGPPCESREPRPDYCRAPMAKSAFHRAFGDDACSRPLAHAADSTGGCHCVDHRCFVADSPEMLFTTMPPPPLLPLPRRKTHRGCGPASDASGPAARASRRRRRRRPRS